MPAWFYILRLRSGTLLPGSNKEFGRTVQRLFVVYREEVQRINALPWRGQLGWTLIKEKGSIRYYGRSGMNKLIRVDYHGAKEVPTGTCHAVLKAAGIKRP